MKHPKIGAIILAAGGSSRLGYPKQEILYKGKPLLVNTVNSVMAACKGPIFVVLGADAPRMKQLLSPVSRPQVHVVVNEYWSSGMGSSLACGMGALRRLNGQLDGVLISICDQPFLTGEMILGLIARTKQVPDKIVGSGYSGTVGPPVIFPRQFFPMLENCSGEKGARHILKEYANDLDSIELPELAFDVDTPEELRFLQENS